MEHKLVGGSPSLKSLIERARQVARTEMDILISAESGTGKELLARLIHQASDRRNRFFKQVELFLRGLTFRQKVLILAAGLLVAIVGAVFYRLTQSADFRVLYSGLSPQDSQAVVQRLSARNIPYELSTDGASVRVPADQLDTVRCERIGEGPSHGRNPGEIASR